MHLCPPGLSFPNLAPRLNPVLTCLALAAALRATVGCTFTSNGHCRRDANVHHFFYTRSASKAEMAPNSSSAGSLCFAHNWFLCFGSGGGGSVLRLA